MLKGAEKRVGGRFSAISKSHELSFEVGCWLKDTPLNAAKFYAQQQI